MKNSFLIDRKFIPYAMLLLALGMGLGFAYLNDTILPFLQIKSSNTGIAVLLERSNYQGDLALTFILIALYILGFIQRKKEDEYIDFLRYQALIKSAIFQTAGLIVGTWFFGGLSFLNLMLMNLFSFLILFNLFFQFELYKTNKKMKQ